MLPYREFIYYLIRRRRKEVPWFSEIRHLTLFLCKPDMLYHISLPHDMFISPVHLIDVISFDNVRFCLLSS